MTEQSKNRSVKRRQDYTAPAFTISQVRLTFELDPQATKVTSVMQVTQQRSGEPLVLDGQHLTLLKLAIDGADMPATTYQLDENSLILQPSAKQFELTIVTQIAPRNNTALEGLYLAGETYCTQCEAEGFRRISYYLDRPDVLAEYFVTIIAPADQYPYLLSNGNKLSEQLDSAGNRIVSWHDPYPKPCYLFALVAGDFDVLSDYFITRSGRNVSLELFVDKGAADKGHFALQALKRAMRWDEQRFNLEYDLDIYMVVAVDFFNMGAMENKGLNIFNSKYILADASSATDRDYFNIESIIGHEYFHNWTGNRVTCRDWFQLSLKEGLTVFRDQEFSADMGSATLCRIDAVKLIRTAQFAEDASPMSHPIRPEQVMEMNNFYTVTVYDKGAEVIRMLQTLLGKHDFARGLALYLQRHDGQAATCDDFLKAMQDVTGLDLSQFQLWYSQSGTPRIDVSQHYDKATMQLCLTARQTLAATADQTEKRPMLIPLNIAFLYADGTVQQHQLRLSLAEQKFTFDNIPQEPVVVWLEHFSAPVKLIANISDQHLLFIARHAPDGVARWDAMQQFWSNKIAVQLNNINQPLQLPAELLQLMQQWLLQPGDDLALTAELLTLPDFDSLAEQYTQIPVDNLLSTLDAFKLQIAQKLVEPLLQCYQNLNIAPYDYTPQQVGVRKLRNICLSYLACSAEHSVCLLQQQYDAADNMTDTIDTLSASLYAQSPVFYSLIEDFARRWQHDALVMDKCFALIASNPQSEVFNAIAQMQQHPLFSWSNPNRVRALLLSFSQRNPRQFHRLDGKGYQLLANSIIKLDPINAQVAARLVTPLLSWQRYDEQRQQLMRDALKAIAALDGISNDVFEKVNKSLN